MSALRFFRLPEVKDRTGLSKTEIYRRMDDGTFPKVVPLGKRSVAWRSDQIEAWIADRIGQAEEAIAAKHTHRATSYRPAARQPSARAP